MHEDKVIQISRSANKKIIRTHGRIVPSGDSEIESSLEYIRGVRAALVPNAKLKDGFFYHIGDYRGQMGMRPVVNAAAGVMPYGVRDNLARVRRHGGSLTDIMNQPYVETLNPMQLKRYGRPAGKTIANDNGDDFDASAVWDVVDDDLMEARGVMDRIQKDSDPSPLKSEPDITSISPSDSTAGSPDDKGVAYALGYAIGAPIAAAIKAARLLSRDNQKMDGSE